MIPKALSFFISFLMATQAAFGFGEKSSEGEKHMNDVITPIALNRFVQTIEMIKDPSEAASAFLPGSTKKDIQYFQEQMKKIGSLPQPKVVGNSLVYFEGKDQITIEFVDLLQRKFLLNGQPLTADPKMPLAMLAEIIEIKYLSHQTASSRLELLHLLLPEVEAGIGTIGKKGFKKVLTAEEMAEKAKETKKDETLIHQLKNSKGFIVSIAILGPIAGYFSNALMVDAVVAICQAAADHNPKWPESWNTDGLCKAWFANKDQAGKKACEPTGLKPFEITSPQHVTGTWTRWVGATPEKEKDDAKTTVVVNASPEKGKDDGNTTVVVKAAFEIRESELDADKKNGVLKAVYNFKYDPDNGKPRLIQVDFPSTEGNLKSLRPEQLRTPEDRKLWQDLTQMTDAIRAAINECEKDLYKNQIERKHREIQDKIPAMRQTPERAIQNGQAAH
jgi:hypothetical protein